MCVSYHALGRYFTGPRVAPRTHIPCRKELGIGTVESIRRVSVEGPSRKAHVHEVGGGGATLLQFWGRYGLLEQQFGEVSRVVGDGEGSVGLLGHVPTDV